jgi:hypothetical protein
MDCYNRITGLSNFDYSPIENMSAMAINSNSHQNTSFFHCHLLFSTIYQSISNLKSYTCTFSYWMNYSNSISGKKQNTTTMVVET